MTQTAPRHASQEEFSYGNEQGRLEELRSMDYAAFKEQILQLRNTHPGEEGAVDFVTHQNTTVGGFFYPRPEDKDMLLEYALMEAQKQDDMQVAALILGSAIVLVHPFSDGNGRTARSLYAYLSRGLNSDDPEYKRLRHNGQSDTVDFSAIHHYGDYMADQIIYSETGITKVADAPWDLSKDPELAKFHFGDREYSGLTESERRQLDVVFGTKFGQEGEDVGRYSGGNDQAVVYAFSKLASEENVNLSINTFQHTAVNVPDTLAQLTPEQKKKIAPYFYDYGTLRAKTCIDLIGKYGDHQISEKGGKISVRDYLVRHSRNYITSKVGYKILHS